MDNSKQESLFHASIYEALREAVKSLGGAKKVGQQLKPQMLADAAGNWLSDSLNPDRREKLDAEQMLWILREARKVGCHTAINFICGDAGYSNPRPIDPEDEKARLQREFIEATKQQSRNIDRLEQLARSNG